MCVRFCCCRQRCTLERNEGIFISEREAVGILKGSIMKLKLDNLAAGSKLLSCLMAQSNC